MRKHIYMNIRRMRTIALVMAVVGGFALIGTSCSDVESNLVEFEEDNTLSSPTDTVYSLVGIINKMQVIADRTVLLGELKGELTALTADANTDLQDVANFDVAAGNAYNQVADYYAVIQNCNYFISKVDTTLSKRGQSVFIKEYAAIKAFRAWTYLQLAIHYGNVPFVTQPILTEKDADPDLFEKYDVKQIANYFISDLAPFVDTDLPNYGSMNSLSSKKFFIPVRVLLGDLCLWAERYSEAAAYYHDFFTKLNDTRPIGGSAISWKDSEFNATVNSFSSCFNYSNDDMLAAIPMETSLYNGVISYLADVYNSTEQNNYYYQATSSEALKQLSRSQKYVLTYTNVTTQLTDTVSPADTLSYSNENMRGDLRLYGVLSQRASGTSNTNYSSIRQTLDKLKTSTSSSENRVITQFVPVYRLASVYLRYAEALNRAGYPQSAFAVLKHGLWYQTLEKYISEEEKAAAGNLIQFSEYTFTRSNTQGIHSRGCGSADADTTYIIPLLASKSDSILYVEDKIVDEMALEEAFEGQRFAELQRIAQHRNDPSFLAGKVARRNGDDAFDNDLYTKLCDQSKWYLPLE